jgi:hypothetical protein
VLDALADLRANALPVLYTLEVEPQALFLPTRHRIEETDALDPSAVAFVPDVRHHDVIERPLLGAAACQSNFYHAKKPSFWLCIKLQGAGQGNWDQTQFVIHVSVTAGRKPLIHGNRLDSGNRAF